MMLSLALVTTTLIGLLASECQAFVGPSSRRLDNTVLTAVKKIGMFGGGTVGGGIVEILRDKQEYLQQLTGSELKIVQVCVRDANKERDWDLPEGCELTTNYDDLLNNDDLDMIVEVMGGTTDARDIVYKALKKGRNVVTANKALIAKYLPEIEDIVASSKDGVEFRYEAAVCGGIPIIRSMQSDFVGDSIQMISGIINGCTNFMLTSMDRDGMTYEQSLAQASELGYAEADPTLDVGGFDARSKLRILMRLGFGVDVNEEDISCRGITDLTKLDFDYAKTMGGSIKLVGVAKTVDTQEDNKERVAAFVSPCYVTEADTLYAINGATNAVEVLSKNLVASTFVGEGAGRFPTANSCVNDIVALAKGDSTAPMIFNPLCKDKIFVNNYESFFYIRLSYRDALGITRQCGEICEKHGVSIHSILQNPITKKDDAAFVLITERVPLTSLLKVVADLEGKDWCRGPPFYMPVLREDWGKR